MTRDSWAVNDKMRCPRDERSQAATLDRAALVDEVVVEYLYFSGLCPYHLIFGRGPISFGVSVSALIATWYSILFPAERNASGPGGDSRFSLPLRHAAAAVCNLQSANQSATGKEKEKEKKDSKQIN